MAEVASTKMSMMSTAINACVLAVTKETNAKYINITYVFVFICTTIILFCFSQLFDIAFFL